VTGAHRPPVEETYVDAFRRRRAIAPEHRRAVLLAMGLDPDAPLDETAPDPVRLLRRPGERVEPAAELVLEDGTSCGVVRRLPRDLPFGYHRLRSDSRDQLLIAAPRAARAPRGRTWGWAAQLYALRSSESWGIGDLADLRGLAAWSAGLGASAILMNPLNAPNPGPDPDPSPYYPSTRRFRDPVYLRIEEVPGADRLAGELEELAAAGRELNGERRIRRPAVLAAKRAALDRIWGARDADEPSFLAYRSAQGEPLRRWSIFAALSERHGPGWQAWPGALRDPASPAVADFALQAADRVAFHAWVQWLLDVQLERAGSAGAGLINDLPVGFDPGGFDAWDWQAELTREATIGSPPDRFNPVGQDWGLLPFVPHRLRAAHYRPFVETLRAAFRHAAGIRIDHALGLFRTWWVPRGAAADGGAYVTAPSEELLAIIALESERAGAVAIGEDLGTVGAGVRAALAARGILSTRVAYFERRLEAVPYLAQVSVTTHDLPTVAGVWTGADLAELEAIGAAHDPAAERGLRRRLEEVSGLPSTAGVAEVISAVHGTVAATPAALLTATLDDALAVPERPNIPGTGQGQRPNWSLALPIPLEALLEDRSVLALAAQLSSERPLADDPGDVDPLHGPQDGKL